MFYFFSFSKVSSILAISSLHVDYELSRDSLVLFFVCFRARQVDPAFVELYESRGIETPGHKMFMRATGK